MATTTSLKPRPGQRITNAGQDFTMKLTNGESRSNHVVEFTEGRRIA